MKHIYIFDGLGNQMFQYSYAMYLQERGEKVCCDHSLCRKLSHNGFELNNIFQGIESRESTIMYLFGLVAHKLIVMKHQSWIGKILLKFGIEYADEAETPYNPHLTQIVRGHWQSPRYLPQKFHFEFRKERLSLASKRMEEQISRDKEYSVSVHIRRGDYLQKGVSSAFGGICTIEYYKKAIATLQEKINNPQFYFFSDDPKWIKETFQGLKYTLIDFNQGLDSWQDMYLMSCCQHHIVANSTFSWWGAWLGQNSSTIVIAPSRYSNIPNLNEDIFPSSWLKIQV